jgi:DNA-binding response OmpR family regulator
LHDEPFDAVVLNGAQDSVTALSLCSALRRNASLYHLPTMVVTANDGSEVKVETKGATITQPAPIAVSALTAGELVIVQGTTNADGTVTATQVTANNAANPAGGGGGGGAGAPAAAPPTTAGG